MIRVFNDYEALSQAAAGMFVDLAGQAIDSRGRFVVALSGGQTPRRLYEPSRIAGSISATSILADGK